jgi:DNA-binding transcriptional ArsR family regulator
LQFKPKIGQGVAVRLLTRVQSRLTFNHMVEYSAAPLDRVFHSLADPTRRDILRRLSGAEHTISELAKPYAMSLAAIAKHINVLDKAGLVIKQRKGKEKMICIVPETIKAAEKHLTEYERIWAARYDALEALLNANNE